MNNIKNYNYLHGFIKQYTTFFNSCFIPLDVKLLLNFPIRLDTESNSSVLLWATGDSCVITVYSILYSTNLSVGTSCSLPSCIPLFKGTRDKGYPKFFIKATDTWCQ